MRLTKSQIEYLAREVRNGRLYLGMVDREQPAWLLMQSAAVFREMARILTLVDLSDFYETETKSKVSRYSEGNKRGWETRKKAAAARSTSQEQGEAA